MANIVDKSVEVGKEEESLSPIDSPTIGEKLLQQGPIEGERELQSDSPIKGLSIVASHGKRMICILRSFLLDYGDLRLKPLEDCISTFYRNIQGISDRRFLKGDKWFKKSPCKVDDFNETFPNELTGENIPNSESSNMKCFPQFTNGSAINIEIKKEGDDVYTLTVSLIPPTDVLPKDEDLENKLVFMVEGSEDKYVKYNYKVPFHTLTFTAKNDCYLIRKVLDSVGDQYNVIIVRHGQGYHNLVGKNPLKFVKMITPTLGTADTHLTTKGIKDAIIGAISINNYFGGTLKGKCKYFSSDLYRAKETAVLIARQLGETDVTVTQLPIIHEISNCEKADSFTWSSIPDMQFPSDAKNPKNKIYCENWFSRNRGKCGDKGIEVTIDYHTFYENITLYNHLFYNQYYHDGKAGYRTYRNEKGTEDTSFFFKPYERNELLLAFTLMEMKRTNTFYINGSTDKKSGIRYDQFGGRNVDEINNILSYEHLNTLPGFRDGENKAKKLLEYYQEQINGTFANKTMAQKRKIRDNLFTGGNRNTLKKRRKRRTNKKRFTNKRRTNKRDNKKKRTYKRGRTIRQRK